MAGGKKPRTTEIQIENTRTGLSMPTLRRAITEHLFFTQARTALIATVNDYYMAFAHTVRDRLLHRWINTIMDYAREDVRVVCYLSAEFLLGPQLGNNLINLGIYDQVRETVDAEGARLDVFLDQEEEPGLGNGGLGRLAACYLDSLATLEIPAMGYGIRYEFGIFDQQIRDGKQVETTDKWLRLGNPWEIQRPEIAYEVGFGGHTESLYDEDGRYAVRWVPDRVVKGVAHDTPIAGYRVNTCNILRLWTAEACESFDFQSFNVGDYYGAVEEKMASENITKVLYPNDEALEGKRLRLEQQYFLVSCSIQDMIRIHLLRNEGMDNFHEKFAVQLNDTHPSLAVAEFMRLLVDCHHLDWDRAWHITRNTCSYTNHTLLPEALEKWPLNLFGSLLPRHLEIVYEINRRFLDEVRELYPGDDERLRRLSLIDESGGKYVRMAHLACVGSKAVNGVAKLHTELLKETVMHDFFEMWPDRFLNITNGVTPRRWMVLSNPRLTRLISDRIGDSWIKHLEDLRQLEELADDAEFRAQWRQVKENNKRRLAEHIRKITGVSVDPASLFDIQVKRIHEYKRQHLNALHIITLYNRIRKNPDIQVIPRTFIFGGKAAPGYFMAKLIIQLINCVAEVVNRDPDVRDRLKVVFFPDFNVKNSHKIYPAADLSEQISTAGKEASGTGNMKFSMNGALTIGTLDGANVEIREEVGAENFFLFGLNVEEVQALKTAGYDPRDHYASNADLKEAIDLIGSGHFSHGDTDLFRPLLDSLLHRDEYLLFADYPSYIEIQEQVSRTYEDRELWARMSILNTARMGRFSSDRSIEEYCDKIWNVRPMPVKLLEYTLRETGLAMKKHEDVA